MKKILFGLFAFFLVGCASPGYNIKIETASNNAEFINVTVHDKRLDEKVYMTESGVNSAHTYMFEVDPPLKTALEGLVKSEISNVHFNTDVDINIQILEIKRHVYFARPDELLCVIESGVAVGKNAESIPVKTTTINNENGSTSPTIFGKLIIDQCLVEHARDLVKFIK